MHYVRDHEIHWSMTAYASYEKTCWWWCFGKSESDLCLISFPFQDSVVKTSLTTWQLKQVYCANSLVLKTLGLTSNTFSQMTTIKRERIRVILLEPTEHRQLVSNIWYLKQRAKTPSTKNKNTHKKNQKQWEFSYINNLSTTENNHQYWLLSL